MNYHLNELLDPVYSFCSKLLTGKYWYLTATIFSLGCIFLFAPPNPDFYGQNYKGGLFVSTVIDRANHIFAPPEYGPDIKHESKTYFRIFIPLFCKFFNISTFQPLYVMQSIIGVLFLCVSFLVSFKITEDKISSFFCGLCLTFLYVGRAAFHDIQGWFDAFAYFFILASMLPIPILFKILLLQCAYFTDERSLFAALILGLFYAISSAKSFGAISLFNKQVLGVAFSIIVYSLVRLFITHYFNFKNIIPNESLHIKHLTHTFWSGLEGLWIMLFIAVLILLKSKKYLLIGMIFAIIVVFLTMTLNIGDQTRSIAYIFPIIFVLLFMVRSSLKDINDLRLILLIALFITLLYPADFYINGFERSYNQPIYIKALRHIFPRSIY